MTEFAYFYWYTVVRTLYTNRFAKKTATGVAVLGTATELLLGAIAGALAQIFTIPVSVIATRQQLGSSSSGKDAAPADESFIGVARDILREDGVTGLWRGLKPSLVLTVNPAITYGVFESEYRQPPFVPFWPRSSRSHYTETANSCCH